MARGGLCTTCVRAPDCALNGETPVWECEEFDPGPATVTLDPPQGASPARTAVLGLCCNCAHREECTFEHPEGGIWHCEEYE